MGAAAQQRGDKSIGQGLWRELDQRQPNDDAARALQIAEDCNTFVRDALAYLNDPRGLRSTTVERMKTRKGWTKLNDVVIATHNAWVDVDCANVSAYAEASIKRAKAVCLLLNFALGTWTIPSHISVPRVATTN